MLVKYKKMYLIKINISQKAKYLMRTSKRLIQKTMFWRKKKQTLQTLQTFDSTPICISDL